MIDETRYRETTVAAERVPRVSLDPNIQTGPEALEYDNAFHKTIAWGPIWAGVLVTVGVQVILSVLGTAIGLSVVQTQPTDPDTAQGVGIGAGIWWICSMIVSLFLGGWTVAWLAAPRRVFSGALHGFVMWCALMALSAALFSIVSGAALGGGLGLLSSSISGNNNNSISSQGNQPGGFMQNFGYQSGQSRSSSQRNESPRDEFDRDFDQNAQNPRYDEDEFSSSSTPSQSSRNRSSSQLDPQQQQQVKKTAETSAAVAWWTWVALLLGAGAAVVGGCMSPTRLDDDSDRYRDYSRRAT